jgi:hypothetical protein
MAWCGRMGVLNGEWYQRVDGSISVEIAVPFCEFERYTG